MAVIYKYALLKAIPDPRRGERVNVGVVVFRDNDLDIRFSDIAKLRAISNVDWDSYIALAIERMKETYPQKCEPTEFLSTYGLLESVINFSDLAWFSTAEEGDYEVRVKEIVDTLVRKPRATLVEKRDRTTKINTEIAKTFRAANVLAAGAETISDHKIVRDYYVSKDEDLKADFVHKNGVYHVTATLDLRRSTVAISQAALKSIVLDKAKNDLSAKRYAVYAAAPGVDQFRPHIELLTEYSDSIFNWLVPEDRTKYTHLVYSTLQ